MQTKKNRLHEVFKYLKSKGLVHTQKELAEKLNSSPPNISRALKGDEEYLTDNLLVRLNEAFNSVFNTNWLITGEGEMLLQNSTKEDLTSTPKPFDLKKFRKDKGYTQEELAKLFNCEEANISTIENKNMALEKHQWDTLVSRHGEVELLGYLKDSDFSSTVGVPYFEDISATGGIITSYCDFKETPTFFINYEHFNDCNAYVPVVGDSMHPQYCSGEIVAIKRILNFDILLWGEAYIVITNDNANNLRTLKFIHPHEQDSKVILRACNPEYKGDTVINKEDILCLFIVKGKIKRNQL